MTLMTEVPGSAVENVEDVAGVKEGLLKEWVK